MAIDYDFKAGEPFEVITVLTSGVKRVSVPDHDILIQHLNVQNDGSTASASTDRLYVMRDRDAAGENVSMAANLNDGVKALIEPGGAVVIRGFDVPIGRDGVRALQLQATGNGCKVQLVKGFFNGEGRR